MANIKSYRDGSRLILVVENCTGDTATKVNQFLLDILGTSESESVPAIVPKEPCAEKAPEISAAVEITASNAAAFQAPSSEEVAMRFMPKGAKRSLGEAIREKDTVAVVQAITALDAADEGVRLTGIKLCKRYIQNDCRHRDPEITGTKEIRNFFTAYRPLISVAIKQILESAGFANLNDFFNLTDEYIHQAAYRSVLDDLIKRTAN